MSLRDERPLVALTMGDVAGVGPELIARAWPQTFVEESNLKLQVSALRRALGDGQGGHRYVVTVPGRGYNFVAPVRPEEPSRAPPPTIAPARLHNLPTAVARMIGREEAAAAMVSRLSRAGVPGAYRRPFALARPHSPLPSPNA